MPEFLRGEEALASGSFSCLKFIARGDVRFLLLLMPFALIAGCANSPVSKAVLDLSHAVIPGAATAPIRLNPAFSYLRVQVENREVYFALGYQDRSPAGTVEVWYSAGGEVLRLRDGRVVGASGMKTEWLAVRLEGLPDWNAIGARAEFIRQRDVSPGYRYGLREAMSIYPIAPPPRTHLKDIDPDKLNWFEEVASASSGLPMARYAMQNISGKTVVIYSEICLDADLCFSWQRWHA